MRLRKSGRVMLTASLVLLIFSALVIWHDYQPSGMALDGNIPPALAGFLRQIPVGNSTSFWSVGLAGEKPWPRDVRRACYADPLAARWQFAFLNQLYPGKVEVVRYRSRADLLELLKQCEAEQPGYLDHLNAGSHTPFRESRWSVSLGLLTALFLGTIGLLIIRKVQQA